MDFNKVMEQYVSAFNSVKGSGGGYSGGNFGGSFSPIGRVLRSRFWLILVVVGIMQLLHYRSVNKLMARYSGLAYESTTVHPYNHCIEVVSGRMVQSGGKIDLDSIERLCLPLNAPISKDNQGGRGSAAATSPSAKPDDNNDIGGGSSCSS